MNLSCLERALAAESSSLSSVCSVFEGSSDELDSAPDFVGFSSAASTSAGGSREVCLGSFVADMAIKKCLSSDPQKHSFISKAGEKKKERTFDEI